MSENTKIEWADHTFNPWEGCQKVGPGCDHCYAENRNARFGGGVAINWGPGAKRRHTSAANWRKPIAWNAAASEFQAKHDRRQRVFCASLADVFDNAVDAAWRTELFTLIRATPNLDWLLLTKRIGNAHFLIGEALINMEGDTELLPTWPWSNVWIGATVVNQEEVDRDIPKLLATPAHLRFLSMEPLLGSVQVANWIGESICATTHSREGEDFNRCDLTGKPCGGIDWVIAGGESGPSARPSHPDWYRSLRDQCAAAGVPFLFKQWGEWSPGRQSPQIGSAQAAKCLFVQLEHEGCSVGAFKCGKKAAGRLLDGVEHNGFPS
jgi:protein gp37